MSWDKDIEMGFGGSPLTYFDIHWPALVGSLDKALRENGLVSAVVESIGPLATWTYDEYFIPLDTAVEKEGLVIDALMDELIG